MNYHEWEKCFLNANQKHYEANMKVFDLEDNGNTSGESYASWTSAVVEWKDAREHFINEYPDFHQRYVNNRGKPTQTKASAEVNGGEYSS